MNLRRYAFPVFDRITGFNLKDGLVRGLEFDTYTREQITEYQIKMFDKLKSIACLSHFYKDYKNVSYNEFPIISKQDITLENENFYTNFRKPFQLISTSGSSGTPHSFPISREMVLAKRISHLRMLSWYNLNRENKEMKIGGSPVGTLKKYYYLFRNKRFWDTFNLNEEYITLIIKEYNKFKPEILVGYPSSLHTICNYIISENIKVHQPKIIITHAENLYEEQKNILKEVFSETKLVNQYWSTEANLGATCPHGNIHIDEDTVICEVHNKDKDGVGELIFTNLFSYDFPLIRFNIEDRVKISEDLCSCGRKTRFFERIDGRKNDFCQLNNGKRIYYADDFGVETKFIDNILKYQFEYYQSTNKLVLNYIAINPDKQINENNILKYYKKNYNIKVHFNRVTEIANEKSGKFKPYKTIE